MLGQVTSQAAAQLFQQPPPPPLPVSAIPSWIWLTTGWGLVALGAALLLWALVRDRRGRTRRRCPRCWYDMAGLALTCPECGHVAKTEHALFRSRRRFRWVVLAAVLALVGTQLADQPNRDRREGWTRAIPSIVLALLARDGDRYSSLPPWRQQVQWAAWHRPMPAWQRAISERVALPIDEDDVRAMFVNRWAWTPGVPRRVCVLLPDGAFGAMGARRRTVIVRSLTSPGVEFSIDASARGVFPQGFTFTDVNLPFSNTMFTPNEVPQPQRAASDLDLPSAPDAPVGERLERFEVVIRNQEGWTIGRWNVEFRARIVATQDEVVSDVDSPAQTAAVLAALSVRSYRSWTPEGGDVTAYGLKFIEDVPGLGAFPFTADVLVDGLIDSTIAPNGVFTLPTAMDTARISIQIRGDRAATVKAPRARAFWSGVLVAPLDAIKRRN